MNALSITFAALFTGGLLVFTLGLLWRITVWLRTPNAVPIPLAPAPRTRAGVVKRLLLEVFLFRSLARASPGTWLPSMLMHYGLLFLLIAHIRFFLDAVPAWLLPFLLGSGWAALACAAGVLALLLRRLLIERIRYISVPSDYLHLVLLLSIIASGAALKRRWPVDLSAVTDFMRGVLHIDWQSLPVHAGLIAHLLGVLVLLLVFPISKLVHAPGVVLAPTFNQRQPGSADRKSGAA